MPTAALTFADRLHACGLTAPQIAALVPGVSVRTVYAWMAAKNKPGHIVQQAVIAAINAPRQRPALERVS